MAPRLAAASSTRLAALAAAFAGASRGATAALTLSCGGHFAYSCSDCPEGNGESWCHGDCMWVSSPGVDSSNNAQCVPKNTTGEAEAAGSGWFAYGILMFIFACFYNQKVIKGPPPLPKVGGMNPPARRGLFDCLCYLDTCLYTAFCMPVVAAKNYYAADICPFWMGCILTFIGTYSPFYCLTVCVRTVLSGRLEEKLGRKSDCCMNLIYNAFCFPCDVGRESLEVDAEIGAQIGICCNVTITPRVIVEVEKVIEREERACSPGGNKYRICGGQGH